MIFHEYNGIKVKEFKDGHAICEHVVREESHNHYGTVHGGMLASIADHVAGYAAISMGRIFVTQSCSINYISNQSTGLVTGRADVIHMGKKTAVVEVRITGEDDKLLVTASYTMFCVGELTEEQMEQVRKEAE